MFSIHSKYTFSQRLGINCTLLESTAAIAGAASSFILTNHCFEISGSTGVSQRWQCPTECRYGFTFTSSPASCRALTIHFRASLTVSPAYEAAFSLSVPSLFSMFIDGRWCSRPISKSTGSCPGVSLRIPVPNRGSISSEATIGSSRPKRGRIAVFPINRACTGSLGLTAMPVSPSIVSGRVVAISTASPGSVNG